MEDLLLQESSAGPIVTKGMLSRARKAKEDNEDVVAAMIKSGLPYGGTVLLLKRPWSAQVLEFIHWCGRILWMEEK